MNERFAGFHKRKACRESFGPESEDESDVVIEGVAKYQCVLKQWAKIIGHQQRLQVANLTTSFSDGRVFTAIVDEYQKYLPQGPLPKRPGTGQLHEKLKEIGCSDAFGEV